MPEPKEIPNTELISQALGTHHGCIRSKTSRAFNLPFPTEKSSFLAAAASARPALLRGSDNPLPTGKDLLLYSTLCDHHKSVHQHPPSGLGIPAEAPETRSHFPLHHDNSVTMLTQDPSDRYSSSMEVRLMTPVLVVRCITAICSCRRSASR